MGGRRAVKNKKWLYLRKIFFAKQGIFDDLDDETPWLPVAAPVAEVSEIQCGPHPQFL